MIYPVSEKSSIAPPKELANFKSASPPPPFQNDVLERGPGENISFKRRFKEVKSKLLEYLLPAWEWIKFTFLCFIFGDGHYEEMVQELVDFREDFLVFAAKISTIDPHLRVDRENKAKERFQGLENDLQAGIKEEMVKILRRYDPDRGSRVYKKQVKDILENDPFREVENKKLHHKEPVMMLAIFNYETRFIHGNVD